MLCRPAQADLFLREHFEYAAGSLTNVAGTSWIKISGANGLNAVDGNLTCAGVQQRGRMVELGSGDMDAKRTVPPGQTNLFASFLVRVDRLASATNDDYFVAFRQASTQIGKLHIIRPNTNTTSFNLGVSVLNETTQWAAQDYAPDTVYFLVIRFSASDGTMDLWVNPAVGAPAPPDATVSTGALGPVSAVGELVLRQGPVWGDGAGALIVDYLRVGTAWHDVTIPLPGTVFMLGLGWSQALPLPFGRLRGGPVR
jgi:hypothetical protein